MSDTKVKLPREVAEAIERIKEHAGEALLYNMQYMYDVCEKEKFDAPKFQPVYNWIQQYGYKEYFKALVNGYEVEESPEDNIRNLYESAINWEKNAKRRNDTTDAHFYLGKASAISQVLNLLNIKIPGINTEGQAHE